MDNNNYLGIRSQYIESKKSEARIEAYKEMSYELRNSAKKYAVKIGDEAVISLKMLDDIIDERLETYFDIYGRGEDDEE